MDEIEITFVISNSYSWKTKLVWLFIERLMGNLIVEYSTAAINLMNQLGYN